MGRLFVETLEGHVYSCKACRMHLAHVEELVSKVRQRPLVPPVARASWDRCGRPDAIVGARRGRIII